LDVAVGCPSAAFWLGDLTSGSISIVGVTPALSTRGFSGFALSMLTLVEADPGQLA